MTALTYRLTKLYVHYDTHTHTHARTQDNVTYFREDDCNLIKYIHSSNALKCDETS